MKEIPEQLRRRPEIAREASGIYEFQLSGTKGGTWSLDCNADPPEVCKGSTGEADVIIEMTEQDFVAFYEGELGGFQAFLNGRIRVKGNMQLAMKMGKLIGRAL